jgi:hypothetical protein
MDSDYIHLYFIATLRTDDEAVLDFLFGLCEWANGSWRLVNSEVKSLL